MKRVQYPAPLQTLIAELKRLPGIGARSAERIALWMIQSSDAHPESLGSAIREVKSAVSPCSQCGFFTESNACQLCADPGRDPNVLCIVEQPTDVLPMERSGAFHGLYHALGGKISPLDHIGPETLRIPALLKRLQAHPPSEVILALGADVEGEATSHYLLQLLKEFPIKVTRLAQGLPAGTGVEYADELTLSRAMNGRIPMGTP
ncbi:MAG: recombination protein RecR [Verrucomicrobia bacterium]|nr:recombination protein RecR [Verrucomicrobiota bacterium]